MQTIEIHALKTGTIKRCFQPRSAWLGLIVTVCSPLSAQFIPPPPITAPAAASVQPNAASPNVRVRVTRPNAPGPKDLLIDADHKEVNGSWRYLRGHVVLETIEMKIQADEVDYNEDTGDSESRGNVRFEHFYSGDKLECDKADYNLDDEVGKFFNVRGTSPAKIQARPGVLTTSNPFYFEGEWAERIHEKYILHSGMITDCRVPRPWWTLKGPKFDIIPNDRAIAYHTWFRVRSIPLFYAPTLYKSLKREPRQSGFLTPNAGHSSLFGYMVGVGYYWAINRSYDMLYRLRYLTERGPASNVDFRGKVKPGTDFNVTLFTVQDRGIKIGTNATGGAIIQKQGGELIALQGKSDLGNGWTARVDLNYLSSFLFRQSFTESFHEAVFSESRSIGYLTKHWDDYGINIIGDRDEQFQSVTPKDLVTIRKLPELQFLERDKEIWNKGLPVWFSFDSSAGLMHRSEPDYVNGVFNGVTFQTPTFVDRLDIAPRITTAFNWKGFSLVPSFTAEETQYSESFQPGQITGAPHGGDFVRNSRSINVDIMFPSLARIYKAPKWMGAKMKHVIETRAQYRDVAGVDDFNRIIKFDGTDIITNTNQLTFSLANRLYVKGEDGNVNEVMSWEVSQARYFDPTFGGAVIPGARNIFQSEADLTGYAFIDQPRNYSPIVSALRVQEKVGLEWRIDYDPLRRTVTNSGFTADYRWSQYFISVGHYDVKSDPVLSPTSNQIRGLIGFGNQNRKGWNGAFSEYYDWKRGLVQFSTLELTYNTDCCGVSVEYRRFNIGTRDDTQYRIGFAVSNIGTFGNMKKQERIF